MVELARSDDDAVVGLYVEDGDYACALAGLSGTESAVVVFNAMAASGSSFGVAALTWMAESAGGDLEAGFEANVRRFAEWSSVTPKGVSIAALTRLIRKQYRFAEDAVEALERSVGLRRPVVFEEAVIIQDRGLYAGPEGQFDMARVRYDFGRGKDFLGIWDRQNPGPPIARFLDGSGRRGSPGVERAHSGERGTSFPTLRRD
jgi:hypothetical protein